MVCGESVCQRKRRTEYHWRKIATDPEYREVCRDSPRKWRDRNPDYWKQYRAAHPNAADRNRQQQKLRDRRQHLRKLANNTSARDLKHSAAEVWLVGAGAEFLANNNSAPGQVWVIEALAPVLLVRTLAHPQNRAPPSYRLENHQKVSGCAGARAGHA